jgi:hypothetical protein
LHIAQFAQVRRRDHRLAAEPERIGDRFGNRIATAARGAQQIVRGPPKYKSVALPPELTVGPEYGLTISRKARDGAADFAMYLLSPPAQARLREFGFIPVALPVGQ